MSTALDNLLDSSAFKDFVFDNISSAVFILDHDFKVQKVNNTFKTLFQKEEMEILNTLCGNSLGCSFAVEEGKQCGSTSECGRCTLRECILKGFSTPDVQSTYITRNFYIDRKPILKYFRVKLKSITYNNDDIAILTVDDITELEEQKIIIKDMADKDYLTGLYNRRYLYEIGDKLFQNVKRTSMNFAVVMADIDFFKNINDTYGHDAGDFLLVSVSDIIKSFLRQSDLLARVGGEEFCILMSVKNKEEAVEVMEKMRKTIEGYKFLFNNKILKTSISCGITCSMEKTLHDMISKADQMLYKAKESGRNIVMAD